MLLEGELQVDAINSNLTFLRAPSLWNLGVWFQGMHSSVTLMESCNCDTILKCKKWVLWIQNQGYWKIWNLCLHKTVKTCYYWISKDCKVKVSCVKVAWSAMVSCSDLLENDIKCVYWQDNPTCQVSIFSKKPFLSNSILCNPKFPLTYCKVFGTQPNSPYLLFFWKHD